MNCGRLLETLSIVILCPPLFVTTTFTAPLVVLTVTEPKLNVEGATPTPARAGTGNKIEPIKNNPINRHTNFVLAI